MSDSSVENFTTRKNPSDLDQKENFASGHPVSEIFIKERPNLIPDHTPGRDITIKPTSPFRELRHATSSSEESSVRVDNDNHRVRSVYDIVQRRTPPEKISPNYSNISTPPTMRNSPVDRMGGYGIDGEHRGYAATTASGAAPNHMYYPPTHHGHPQGYPQGYGHNINPAYMAGGHHGYPGPVPYGHGHPVYYPQPPPAPVDTTPDYEDMTLEDQKEAKLIFKSKFASLKENYPERNFSDYDPELPLRLVHKIYEEHLKNITIESNSSITKVLLVMMFLGIELFAIKVLNLDLRGYTRSQMQSMKRYDRLLLELGEKYTGGGSNWPIEARLIFLAFVNAAVIVAVKFACDKMGYTDSTGLIKMVNNMIGGGVDAMVEAKPEPTVDPVTKTADPVPRDASHNLMGTVQNLMAMAGQAFGNSTGGDLASAIGDMGDKFVENATKPKTAAVPVGAPTPGPAAKKGIRFGQRK
jgi:hypothetical protein